MIVGLTGKKGHGKDTIGSYLVEHHGFVRVSFADPMKRSVAALFDVTVEELEKWKNDPCAVVTIGMAVEEGFIVGKSQTIRSILQRYGTEAHREIPEFGDDVWTEMGRRSILGHAYVDGDKDTGIKVDDVVVTDVRFENEAAVIRECGGIVVKVHDPRKDDGGADTHASEQTPEPDFTVWNGGTFEELYAQVRYDVLGVAGEPTYA